MNKPFSLLVALLFFVSNCFADGPDKIKMAKAKLKYNEQDYNGALKLYREAAEKSPADAEVNYNIAECYIQLKDNENVVVYLEKVKATNDKLEKMLYFQLGRAYQEVGKPQEALTAYETFYNVKGIDKADAEQAIFYKKQCQTAIELTQKPVNVRITNMGKNINSEVNDYHPTVTADGKTMILTSRRGDGKSQKKDPSDNGFYEDIFISHFNDTTREWEKAEPILGGLNTDGHDAANSITADGHRILTFKNEPGNGGDIYMSKANKNGKWSPAKPLPKPINTPYWESYGCLSADGNNLYFVSERNSGLGRGDIYVSKKEGRDAWSKPENLGPKVNSAEDEMGLFLHPDGKTLFFSSKRSNSMGGYDIFKTTFDGEWSAPVNVGYPINTTADEHDFVLSTDGKKAWFVSKREGTMGEYDIFQIDLTNYNIMGSDGFSKPVAHGLSILKGTVIDKDANTIYGAVVKILDDAGKMVTYTESDEDGNYFLTLDGDKDYTISVELSGFNDFKEKIFIPKDPAGTQTVAKGLVLDRKQ